jgi:hypothetical protein
MPHVKNIKNVKCQTANSKHATNVKGRVSNATKCPDAFQYQQCEVSKMSQMSDTTQCKAMHCKAIQSNANKARQVKAKHNYAKQNKAILSIGITIFLKNLTVAVLFLGDASFI